MMLGIGVVILGYKMIVYVEDGRVNIVVKGLGFLMVVELLCWFCLFI